MRGTSKPEKCPICGVEIDVGDADCVQLHGGEDGLMHASCFEQYEQENETEGGCDESEQ